MRNIPVDIYWRVIASVKLHFRCTYIRDAADHRHPVFLAHLTGIAIAFLLIVSCGGSAAKPDFTFAVSPTSVTLGQGFTSVAIMSGASPLNGFQGPSVTVTLSGLPPGATTQPMFPLQVPVCGGDVNLQVDCELLSPQFTITTTDATPLGTVTLTLRASSGSLAHEATLTMVTAPVVLALQQGTALYLESRANGHTARIGLDTAWGGAIVEVSMDGTNFVNRHDTGRDVQPALYDGAASYPAWGPGSAYGWNPVLAGDAYGRGSTVQMHTVSPGSLYTQSAPLQWWPDNFGGGASAPVAADMTFEQTVTVEPSAPLAFKVHYKLIHNGTDTHYNSGQEFPAVYVNSTYTRFAYYGGASPWSNGPLTTTTVTEIPTNPSPAASFAPEHWGALVDAGNQGLAVYVPGQYPYENAWSFAGLSGSGPLGNATIFMLPSVVFTISPGTVIEGDVYLVPGDLSAARAAIYAIHQGLATADISAPLVNIEQPAANATISGMASVSGWAFDNVALDAVNVYVDGIAMGSVSTGISRPDIANAYPHVAPSDSGWTFTLDTTKLANGVHSLTIHATDSAGNTAINAPLSVAVSN